MTGPGSTVFAKLLCSLFLIGSAAAGFPEEDCFVNDFACDIHDNNTLAILPNVASLAECRVLCQDMVNCSYITHYGEESFPIDNSCVLHSLCPDIHVCPDCTSEAARCWQFCSGPLEGHVGDNLVSYRPDVEEEIDCINACKANDRCSYYTHHNGTDPDLPGVCFLLSSLQEPYKSCSSCSSGPVDCTQSSDLCFFLKEDGKLSKNLIINTTSTTFTVTPVTLGDCRDITIVAVGGGGIGEGSHSVGGGGSGYVELKTISASDITGHRLLEVTVGAEQEESSVKLGGKLLVVARQGETVASEALPGGAGYSGGGGGSGSNSYAGANGGSDGGDGLTNPHSGAPGGKGSGVDVTTLPVAGFSLSPGSAGDGRSGGGTGGGGAGGILVDGWGPPAANMYCGEGYGAGSLNGYAANYGVVLCSF